MHDRYTVIFAGPDTTIIPDQNGPFRSDAAARAAAVEHVQEHLVACRRALMVLRKSGNFAEYRLRVAEAEGGFGVGGEAEAGRRDGSTG